MKTAEEILDKHGASIVSLVTGKGPFERGSFTRDAAIAAMKEYASLIASEKESKWVAERDAFAIEFAKYMEIDAWEIDYQRQKTHTAQEHLEMFKSERFPLAPKPEFKP